MNRWAGCLEGNSTHQVENQRERSQADQQVGEEAAGLMMSTRSSALITPVGMLVAASS